MWLRLGLGLGSELLALYKCHEYFLVGSDLLTSTLNTNTILINYGISSCHEVCYSEEP